MIIAGRPVVVHDVWQRARNVDRAAAVVVIASAIGRIVVAGRVVVIRLTVVSRVPGNTGPVHK
jgi:hypothetical protein